MSKTLENLPKAIFEEENETDAVSTKFSNDVEINDFVWIENSCNGRSQEQDDGDNTNKAGIVTQCAANNQTSEEIPQKCDTVGIEKSKIATDKSIKELSAEQNYWDHDGASFKKINGTKLKHLTSQSVSRKLHKVIAAREVVTREPSYFNLCRSTTATLEKLFKGNYVGRFHNVVGRGSNSVVIHSDCANTCSINIRLFANGNAIKIYRLSKDLKKNYAIYKHTQKEYNRLLLLNNSYAYSPPRVVHRVKNIIVMEFAGTDQKTDPSISDLPADRSDNMYHSMVNEMSRWYNKAHLVHGRLSTKNVFYCAIDDSLGVQYYPTVLGWSQSVRADHPEALKKLMNDCIFVTKFFGNRDVTVKPVQELFKEITGVDKISNKVLEISTGNLWQASQQSNPNRVHIDKGSIGNSRFKRW